MTLDDFEQLGATLADPYRPSHKIQHLIFVNLGQLIVTLSDSEQPVLISKMSIKYTSHR